MAYTADDAPFVHTFEVRAHDLDNTGSVGMAALIRLTETQRWHVFAGPLLGLFGRAVVRSQSLVMHERLAFGDRIKMSMWVAHVGRSSALFGQSIVDERHPQRMAAEVAVTIVATDAAGRPEPIGDVARSHLVERPTLATRRDYPTAPQDPFRHPIVVQHHDLDLLQHINQARYVDYINSTRHAAAASQGFAAGFDGARACLRLDLSYDDEARMGEALSGLTFSTGPDQLAVQLRRERDGKVITQATLDLEGKSTQHARPRPLLWQANEAS